jgi:tagatose-6-phosphate ketose/aldose isomerase
MLAEDPRKMPGFSLSNTQDRGAAHTAQEINQQPRLWLKTWQLLVEQQPGLEAFLEEVCRHGDPDVILAGAGTSAFIGNILQGPFMKNTGWITRAIPTTDLITHPQHYFKKKGSTLLISFARSGDSPESVAASELAEVFCDRLYHLILTCNPSGRLANGGSRIPTCIFFLPPEANDQSLVMTGSFSTMLLAGLLISRIGRISGLQEEGRRLAIYGQQVIERYADKLQDIAQLDFKRAVFLGSGPLQGVARESHLKLQELTAGKVICSFDSFLGFRHGPKAVINSSTLLIYLFSSSPFVHQYELDLVKSINREESGLYRIGIAETGGSDPGLDELIVFSDGTLRLNEDLFPVCSVLPAQMLGFFKCLQLGLKPDNPSENGTITRVVQGVKIYPYP